MKTGYDPSPEARKFLESIGVYLEYTSTGIAYRTKVILDELLSGVPSRQLERKYDISRQGIDLALRRHTGIRIGQVSRVYKAEHKMYTMAGLDLMFQSGMYYSQRDMAKAAGVSIKTVQEFMHNNPEYRFRKKNTWTEVRVSEEELLNEIRRVARVVEGQGRILTGPIYDEFRKPGALTQVRILQRFGTWTAACKAAGVRCRPPAYTRTYEHKWTREEALDWVIAYLTENPGEWSFVKYDEWARKMRRQGENAPSGGSIRNRISRKWADILDEALAHLTFVEV